MRTGVLALQGGFAAHADALRELDLEPVLVRHPAELPDLAGLVLPGGESSALLVLMNGEPWEPALADFLREGGAVLATCAGAILLAREVVRPRQRSLGLLDALLERNGYGRQAESFVAQVEAPALGAPLEAVFIRAPRVLGVGPGVEVLASLGGQPVLMQQGRLLAATFHPELTADRRVHGRFRDLLLPAGEPSRAGKGTLTC